MEKSDVTADLKIRKIRAGTVDWLREEAKKNGRSLEGHVRFLIELMWERREQ